MAIHLLAGSCCPVGCTLYFPVLPVVYNNHINQQSYVNNSTAYILPFENCDMVFTLAC